MRKVFTIQRIALALATFTLGFLLVTAFFIQERGRAVIPSRRPQLIEILKEREQRKTELREELNKLREEQAKYEKEIAKSQGELTGFDSQLENLKLEAGLTSLTGQGIIVILSDSMKKIPSGEDPSNYLVHDSDLRFVVNALWKAGAEAVEINGERLIAISPIRCVGTTVLINSTLQGSPYTIKAIGNSEKLEAAMKKDNDFINTINKLFLKYDIGFTTEKSKNLDISGYKGSLRLKNAKPWKGD